MRPVRVVTYLPQTTSRPRVLVARPVSTAVLIALLALPLAACENPRNDASSAGGSSSEESAAERSNADDKQREEGREEGDAYADKREAMVREQLETRDIDDAEVLEAMREVRRHRFVPSRWLSHAYRDRPLPIGHDQTISQPYIVAKMTQALEVDDDHRVLEIGTGSGYQAAVMSRLADRVYSIEIVCELADRAAEDLATHGYDNVEVTCGDGYEGWPEHAPFDRIIVTAAPPEIPEALVEQLEVGGRMVLPVGERIQELKIVEKQKDGSIETAEMMKVRFVPMVHGDAGE